MKCCATTKARIPCKNTANHGQFCGIHIKKTNVQTITVEIRMSEFFQSGSGKGRGSNDANNKKREEILTTLYDSTEPDLQPIREKWIQFLRSLCQDFSRVRVVRHGGRGANHDFEIFFYKDDGLIKHIPKAEFKHSVSRIDKMPEYFSPAADKPYFEKVYADIFYDEYLDRVCAVYGLVKPDRETYLRLVYSNNYDKHPFFRTLYTMETSGTREQTKQKQEIVRESISKYLESTVHTINLQKLSTDIHNRQSNKLFILWNLTEFISDQLHDDEMELTHVEGIKNGNTVVVVSKAGTRHNMLLRWKNHLGVLYPAWQISLTR